MEAPANLFDAVAAVRDFDIMAEARRIYDERKANTAAGSKMLAADMKFIGAERRFCVAQAQSNFRELQYAAQRAAAEADALGAVTPQAAAYRIDQIDGELSRLSYAPLQIDIGDRERNLRAERKRLATRLQPVEA